MRACVRAYVCVCASVRACIRVCVCVRAHACVCYEIEGEIASYSNSSISGEMGLVDLCINLVINRH